MEQVRNLLIGREPIRKLAINQPSEQSALLMGFLNGQSAALSAHRHTCDERFMVRDSIAKDMQVY
ncbi:hypothetical protein [Plantibacter sp. YIM 135347]|uniref:hypothetical protein n=1 Tax=Plantibacter sp. YIM 135347 TaxID=3423919 RepID=UPI003D348030